jgi:hypothetical protein
MVCPKAKRPGKGDNKKKDIERKLQKKLHNQKATGFIMGRKKSNRASLHVTSVDTSVTPPLPFFPSRYGAGHSPVISLTSGRKTRCYQRAVNFLFLPKNVLKFISPNQ